MKIDPKFYQYDCKEGENLDLRQANAILRHEPDIIIFEMPQSEKGPDTEFNKYPCNKKPLNKVDDIKEKLKISAQKFPYAESDIYVWDNILKMWKQNINTQIYNVDMSNDFRSVYYDNFTYPACRNDWLFWVYLYIREMYMTKNIQYILDNYKIKKKPIVLVFLQSIHFKHVKFLMTDPSKKQIWKYYFGKFKNIAPNKDLDDKIKKRSVKIYKYWNKIQNFY